MPIFATCWNLPRHSHTRQNARQILGAVQTGRCDASATPRGDPWARRSLTFHPFQLATLRQVSSPNRVYIDSIPNHSTVMSPCDAPPDLPCRLQRTGQEALQRTRSASDSGLIVPGQLPTHVTMDGVRSTAIMSLDGSGNAVSASPRAKSLRQTSTR